MFDLIWDMDGVLLDTEPIYLRVESEVVSQYNKDIRPLLPQLLGRTASDCAELTVKSLDLPLSGSEYLRLRNEKLMLEMPQCVILPGIERVIRHLRCLDPRPRLAIATSSPRDLLHAKQQGKKAFFDLFDAIVCGDDVQHGKPDPEIFIKAAAAIDADPRHCIVFEDAPMGLRAARLAGMKAVALPNPLVDVALYEQEEPMAIVPGGSILNFDISSLGFPPLSSA